MQAYICTKCGKVWFSAANPEDLLVKFCDCGGELELAESSPKN